MVTGCLAIVAGFSHSEFEQALRLAEDINMSNLEGSVAIVTGGARGLGESIVRAIVDAGGKVMITDILDELGETLANELGDSARYRRMDVANSRDWADTVAEAEKAFGHVTILVANAVRHNMGSFDDMTEEEFTRVWQVNELGCFLGMKAVVPSMRRAGIGSIINIGSIASVHASGGVAYCASKFAIRGMSKSVARELAPENIRVNTVLPSWMIGPSSEALDQQRVSSALPLRRMGDTSKIAKLVVFLASEDAEFITGSDHLVDGGAMLMGTYEVMGLLQGKGLGDLSAEDLLPGSK